MPSTFDSEDNLAECFKDSQPGPVNVSDLRAGDILLHYRSRRGLISRAIARIIQKSTAHPYTHASIFLGDNHVAESNVWPLPPQVRKISLEAAIKPDSRTAVFRSQCGFGPDRIVTLNAFIDELIQRRTWYDFRSLVGFRSRVDNHIGNQLDKLAEYLTDNASISKYLNRKYFCSALIVACYCVVGIIDDSATPIYKPEMYSPGAIGDDPTFGYIVGYLIHSDSQIPSDDPFINNSTFRSILGVDYL